MKVAIRNITVGQVYCFVLSVIFLLEIWGIIELSLKLNVSFAIDLLVLLLFGLFMLIAVILSVYLGYVFAFREKNWSSLLVTSLYLLGFIGLFVANHINSSLIVGTPNSAPQLDIFDLAYYFVILLNLIYFGIIGFSKKKK